MTIKITSFVLGDYQTNCHVVTDGDKDHVTKALAPFIGKKNLLELLKIQDILSIQLLINNLI